MLSTKEINQAIDQFRISMIEANNPELNYEHLLLECDQFNQELESLNSVDFDSELDDIKY